MLFKELPEDNLKIQVTVFWQSFIYHKSKEEDSFYNKHKNKLIFWYISPVSLILKRHPMKYETFQHAFFNIILLRTLDKKKVNSRMLCKNFCKAVLQIF